MSGTKKILAVVHHGPSDLGRVGPILAAAGYRFDICWPVDGDALPSSLAEYDGVTIFGGIMGAYDDHIFGIRAELDWIPKVVSAGCPLFGICLGGQLVARALGGKAYKQPDGIWEVGYYPVAPTPAGADVFPDGPQHFFSWHQDVFEPPAGTELIGAGAQAAPNQMFRFGASTYGVQFHPEAPRALFETWMKGSPDFEKHKGAKPRAQSVLDAERYERSADAWLAGFLTRWLEPAQSHVRLNTG